MRHVPDIERRSRLVRRHALGPDHRLTDPLAATESVVCLHATEPATVYLSVAARTEGVTVADVDRALYAERSLVKQLAMRRTLFAFPRDLLPAAWGSASARVARTERARMAGDAVKAGFTADGDAWVEQACAEVLTALAAARDGLSTTEVRQRVPVVDVKVDVTAGSVWGAARVLTLLAARAAIVRGESTSHWRVSRYRWRLADEWLGEAPEPWQEQPGYAEIVRRWLARFGPGTETDLAWWLGGTRTAVRRALTDLAAVAVSLDGGATGWVLPEDEEPEPGVAPAAVLLPVLDPTVMGWKERDWYLADLGSELFDRNGNAGTTAWWHGRVVGCWVQDPDGVISVHRLADVPAAGRRALATESARLTGWLDGVSVGTVYPSPAMKAARLP
ncbi:MAG: winged helix DNA-binding domain-containing protein [Nocardioides sp.]